MAKHTLDETTTVVQFIFEHLADFPALLETQGIFSQGGSKDKINELIDKILKHETFAHTRYGPHDYIGALTYVLKEDLTLDLNAAQPLISTLTLLKLENPGSIENAIRAFNTYIDRLARSSDKKDNMLAQALYSYCHFAQEAAQYYIKNKMNTEKISQILGPLFQPLLMPDKDPSLNTPTLNALFKHAIDSGNFEMPFEIKYPNPISDTENFMPVTSLRNLILTSSSPEEDEEEDDSTLHPPKKKKDKKARKTRKN